MFRLLGRTKNAKQCAERCIAEARRRALLGSYLVWNFRDREEWDLTETVGRWRGWHESTDLASVDRARQRKEREEADAAGTWSDESGGEQAKNPSIRCDTYQAIRTPIEIVYSGPCRTSFHVVLQ